MFSPYSYKASVTAADGDELAALGGKFGETSASDEYKCVIGRS